MVGANVRGSRLAQGLSQTELARRAGLDLATVYRVEKGVPTRKSTIRKIAEGLSIFYEDLLLNKDWSARQSELLVHRASSARWFPGKDARRRAPSALDAHVEPAERRRLSTLGFVPWFTSPPMVVPKDGPGLVVLEISGVMDEEGLNSSFYADGAVLVLSGEVRVTVREQFVDLAIGDWVSFKTRDLTSIECLSKPDPAHVLWVGGTRPRKKR